MTFIERNKKNIVAGLKEYFNKMVDVLFAYEIPFSEFKEYYIHLKNAIKSRLLDNYMYYVVALSNSRVINAKDHEEEYFDCLNYLSDLIDNNLTKYENNKFSKQVEDLCKIIKSSQMSLDQFVSCCEFLNRIVTAYVDIDYFEIANCLLNADVAIGNSLENNLLYYWGQMYIRSLLNVEEDEEDYTVQNVM